MQINVTIGTNRNSTNLALQYLVSALHRVTFELGELEQKFFPSSVPGTSRVSEAILINPPSRFGSTGAAIFYLYLRRTARTRP